MVYVIGMEFLFFRKSIAMFCWTENLKIENLFYFS